MKNPVAKCLQCGYEFISPNLFNFFGATNVHFSSVGTNCPKCGGMAEILDANYKVSGGDWSLHEAPKKTRDVFDRLASLQRKADSDPGKVSIEDVADALGVSSPEELETLNKISKGRTIGEIIAFVMMLLLTFATNTKTDIKFDLNEFYTQWEISHNTESDETKSEQMVHLHNAKEVTSADAEHPGQSTSDDANHEEPTAAPKHQGKPSSRSRSEHQERKRARGAMRAASQRPK